LDSTAGFLTPVTVGTAVLVGLGVPAFEAAAYVLVASSLPPIFGAMGIPVVVLAEVTELPLLALAQRQAVVAGLLFAGFPSWLTFTFGGWPALRRLWSYSAAAGLAYGVTVWWMASRISFYPAGLTASIAAMLAVVMVMAWRKNDRHPTNPLPLRAIVSPWWPYLLLMAMVTVWSLPVVSRWLNQFTLHIPVPLLAASLPYRLDFVASAGTAILVTCLIFGGMARLSSSQGRQAVRLTARQIHYPVINMMAMLALAQIMNFSGMTLALGSAVANTGLAFPLISPYLSWLGAAIAGSNTASNAILGRLQATTATQLGLEPLLVVALAGAAAPLGKMVAPQVLAAAVGAGNIAGSEGRLLRLGLWHSLLWTGLIALAGWLLAGG
jgi:lactate permease